MPGAKMRAENMDRKLGEGNKPEKRNRTAPIKKGVQEGDRVERGYSRPPLARMQRVHEWLMEDRYPNCRKIAEEFEVSTKTVQRDVNFMRDQMGLPIDYDKERFGFHYTRSVSGFPALGASTVKARENSWKKFAPAPPLGEMPPLGPASRHAQRVRIRFDPESVRMLRERTWHATQEIHRLPNGGADVTFRAADEWTIVQWVLSWGAHAWVVEPARLRSRVREVAREIVARH